MPDESESSENTAVEAAAVAAAETTNIIEEIKTSASEAIEHAEERVEAAEDAAELIAAAAMEAERSRQVEDLRRDLDVCRTSITNLKAELLAELEPLKIQLAELISRPQSTVVLQSDNPLSTQTLPQAETVEIAEPGSLMSQSENAGVQEDQPPVKARRRKLIL